MATTFPGVEDPVELEGMADMVAVVAEAKSVVGMVVLAVEAVAMTQEWVLVIKIMLGTVVLVVVVVAVMVMVLLEDLAALAAVMGAGQ